MGLLHTHQALYWKHLYIYLFFSNYLLNQSYEDIMAVGRLKHFFHMQNL